MIFGALLHHIGRIAKATRTPLDADCVAEMVADDEALGRRLDAFDRALDAIRKASLESCGELTERVERLERHVGIRE